MATAKKLARLEALERKSAPAKPLLVVWQDITDRSEFHTKPRSEAGEPEYSESDLAALKERHTLIIVKYQERSTS